MWLQVTKVPLVWMMALPILTRCWNVGDAGLHLNLYWHGWKLMAAAILDVYASNTTKNELASWLLQYMRNIPLVLQLEFTVQFHSIWFCKHMDWLQKRDPTTKETGFCSQHMPIWSYIMETELTGIKDNWTNMEEFSKYKTMVPSLDDDNTSSLQWKDLLMLFCSCSPKK